LGQKKLRNLSKKNFSKKSGPKNVFRSFSLENLFYIIWSKKNKTNSWAPKNLEIFQNLKIGSENLFSLFFTGKPVLSHRWTRTRCKINCSYPTTLRWLIFADLDLCMVIVLTNLLLLRGDDNGTMQLRSNDNLLMHGKRRI
jgi:hypothetical protein